jgi:hypothetical protein
VGGGVVGVPLTQGKVALIDSADLSLVKPFVWMAQRHRTGTFYARAAGGYLKMHRLLTGAAPGQVVDHVNRDPLDNRRSNLRVCTHRESTWNTIKHNRTGYMGVRRLPRGKRWEARIVTDGRRVVIGYYGSPEEAARAYDRAVLEQRGNFAVLNFPGEAS